MVKERNYDFCKRLLEVHKKDRRDFSLTKNDDEFEFVQNRKRYRGIITKVEVPEKRQELIYRYQK